MTHARIDRRTVVDPVYYVHVDIVVATRDAARLWVQALTQFRDTDTSTEYWNASSAMCARGQLATTHAYCWFAWFQPWADATPTLDELSTIVHETAHLTASILSVRGIPLSDDTDEVYAYYHAWWFRQVAAFQHDRRHRRRRLRG